MSVLSLPPYIDIRKTRTTTFTTFFSSPFTFSKPRFLSLEKVKGEEKKATLNSNGPAALNSDRGRRFQTEDGLSF